MVSWNGATEGDYSQYSPIQNMSIKDLDARYYFVPKPTGIAATDTANIQAAIDAASISARGGIIRLSAGDYYLSTAGLVFTTNANGIGFIGAGGTAQGNGLVWGTTRLMASGTGTAITVGGSQSMYAGPIFKDFQLVGDSNQAKGFWLKGQSNFRFDDVTVSGFTAGTSIHLDSNGYNSQYGELRGVQINDFLTGILISGSNCVRIIGGMLDANHNSGVIRAGSTGIKLTSGDTLRAFGTVIQYAATGYDLAVGINPELHGIRLEGFTTGIKNAAPDCRVNGGSFNNSIVGLSGTAMNNISPATNLMWDPGSIVQVSTALSDTGTGTRNRTAI